MSTSSVLILVGGVAGFTVGGPIDAVDGHGVASAVAPNLNLEGHPGNIRQ